MKSFSATSQDAASSLVIVGKPSDDFDAFLRARSREYLRIARAMTSSRADAEDLFQSAAERLYKRWYGVRRIRDPDAYFRRSIINAAIDGSRRRQRRPEHLRASLPDDVSYCEDGFQRVEEEVLPLLQALPIRQRAVLVLRILEDMDTEQTAQFLDMPIGTVKSHLSRGLAVLRASLALTTEDPRGRPV